MKTTNDKGEKMNILSYIAENWHKILVVALAIFHIWDRFERSSLFARFFPKDEPKAETKAEEKAEEVKAKKPARPKKEKKHKK